jgi:hypothetical protein
MSEREALQAIIIAYDEWLAGSASFGRHKVDLAVNAAKSALVERAVPSAPKTPGEDAWLDELAQITCLYHSSVRDKLRTFLRAYRANLLAAAQPRELAWLIERGGLCFGFRDRKFAWVTFTNESALRFSRRSDAIRFIEAMRDVLGGASNLDDVLVTDHSWSAARYV